MQISQQTSHSRIFYNRIFYSKILYWIPAGLFAKYPITKFNIKFLNFLSATTNSTWLSSTTKVIIAPLRIHGNTNSVKMCKRVVDNSATTRNSSVYLIQQIWDLFSKQQRCIQSLSCSLLLNQSLTTTSANISLSMKGGGRINQFGDIKTSAFNRRIHWRHVTGWWSVQIKSRPWNEANHSIIAYSP